MMYASLSLYLSLDHSLSLPLILFLSLPPSLSYAKANALQPMLSHELKEVRQNAFFLSVVASGGAGSGVLRCPREVCLHFYVNINICVYIYTWKFVYVCACVYIYI